PLTPEERQVVRTLRRHVERLAGEIGERHVWRPDALEAAEMYIVSVLEELGYAVRRRPYTVRGTEGANLEVEVTGTARPEEIVVVGAHYDTVPGSPGADDNASGVAALLEIARLLRGMKLERTLRLVGFVNEEAPFFTTEEMGSRRYAAEAAAAGENVVAMFSLESLGYYSDESGSQRYPAGLGLFYPDRADFLGFVGNLASRDLLHRSIEAFRRHAAFPSEGIAAPEGLVGVSWSDHSSFWRQGYPAIMVTGTALFRNPDYHTAGDVPERLDYERMARVVAGLAVVFAAEAGLSGSTDLSRERNRPDAPETP
ncbi:MAG: M20/M25/M40 family metallo-hydrolase, partial [Candidatus Binatia bacterium]